VEAKEHALFWMKLARTVWLGPGNEKYLAEIDEDIKRVEEWAASGKAGLPPGIGGPIRHVPVNHESLDGLKCKRCGIEAIYWKHFPDCSMFKPTSDVARAAFRST
jgi:hypothetical protein